MYLHALKDKLGATQCHPDVIKFIRENLGAARSMGAGQQDLTDNADWSGGGRGDTELAGQHDEQHGSSQGKCRHW